MTHRKVIRDAGRAALAALFPFRQASSQWRLPTNAEELPVWSVATPQETIVQMDKRHWDRAVVLQIVVKRAGADLEDLLDEDAAAIEAAVVPALRLICREADLTETIIDMDSAGSAPVGQLVLRILCRTETTNFS